MKQKQKFNVFVIVLVIIAIIVASYLVMRKSPQDEMRAALATPEADNIPMEQVVIYRTRSDYGPFARAIFAQGQLPCPAGLACSLYVEANKVNGPTGLQSPGARCSLVQGMTSYNQDTITMDRTFCPDFNNAILDGVPYADIVPTEDVFIHKTNGERCVSGNEYFINPANLFFRDYLIRRGAEKLEQHKLNTLFLDDLRPGWSQITGACGGSAPREYPSQAEYYAQLVDLARYVYDNLAGKIEGNIAVAGSHWTSYQFMDGLMCESCFSNWGGSWPAPSRMVSDLSALQAWTATGKTLYVIIYPPDTSDASNRFTFAAGLLVANQNNTFFHFGGSGEYYPIPEYVYGLGSPAGSYSCNDAVCSRQFSNGRVVVDFSQRTGIITLGDLQSPTTIPNTSTAIPTKINTPTIVPSTISPIETITPTPTMICVQALDVWVCNRKP